ncbi:MAG TPA: endolytic transglycosylase MltG [Streptosporangiaceae bacterium]
MSRDGYERWDDDRGGRRTGRDSDRYPRARRRGRRGARADEEWDGARGDDGVATYTSDQYGQLSQPGGYRDPAGPNPDYSNPGYGSPYVDPGVANSGGFPMPEGYGSSGPRGSRGGREEYADESFGRAEPGYGEQAAYGDSGGYPAGGGAAYPNGGYDGAGYNGAGYGDAGYDGAGYGGADHNGAGYDGAGYNTPGHDNGAYNGPSYQGDGYGGAAQGGAGYPGSGYDDPRYESGYDGAGYETSGYDSAGYNGAGDDGSGYERDSYGGATYGGNGYDEDYDDRYAPPSSPHGQQADDTGFGDGRVSRSGPFRLQDSVDDPGLRGRRGGHPADAFDADDARHNGFFSGFPGGGGGGGESRPPKRKRGRGRAAALIAVVIIFAVVGGGGYFGYSKYSARHANYTGSGTGSVIFEVKSGDSADSLASQLVSKGVIKSVAPFDAAAKDSGKSSLLEPGFFRLRKHMNAALAWALLINPKSRVQTTVAVPDGLRATKIIALLATKTGIPLSQFESALKDTSALGLPAWAKGNPEGFLWPATYPFDPGTSALKILQTMVKQATTEFANINLAQEAKTAKFSEYQVLIEASLLEGEVGPKYYAKVARVIDNRLNMVPEMTLGLDSTVAYATNKYIFNLTAKDLAIDSPYNTTTHLGLPPGPIDSPDVTAIQSVLHPAPKANTWIYFVTVNKAGLTLFTDSRPQSIIWGNEAKQNGV